jgi:hypothetical protein
MRIRRGPQPASGRRVKEISVGGQGSPFTGLNTTFPYTQLKDGESPSFYNVRLYARKSDDRRVAVGTRKGPSFYSVPIGETVDQQQTSTTGADAFAITTTTWVGSKFTAGTTGRLTKVDVNVYKNVAPTQHLIVAIYTDSSGVPGTLLATSSILSSALTGSAAYATARFVEAPAVTSASVYWIVCYMQDGGTGSYAWTTTTNAVAAASSSNSGGTWTPSASVAMNLKTYVSTDSPFLGGFRYDPSTDVAKTVIAHGTNVYTVSDIDGTTTSIKSGLNASATEYNFGQVDDKVFWVNGYDVIHYYDNSTVSTITDPQAAVGKYIAFHKGRMFVAGQSDPTRMSYSDFADYTSWSSTGFQHVPQSKTGDPITGITVFQDNLIIFTRKTKYILFGDDPGNFVLRQASGKKGAVNQAVIKSDPNYVYFLSDDGIYRFNGSQDELMSDAVQTEVDNIEDKTKCAAAVQDNYYRLYYPRTTSVVNDACLVWDTLNKLWLRDTDTYVDKPFLDETNNLIEGSSVCGAIYHAEQQYSDMGKPIEFIYWTKYYGDGLRKIFLRRLILSLRLQTQPYSLNVYIDLDQRNTNGISYQIDAQASGAEYGDGTQFGDGTTWGSHTVSVPDTLVGSEAYWHQLRFERTGVDTPVEILSYLMQTRIRRTE